jgi:hypothetical protein
MTSKLAKVLTEKGRKQIKGKNFALPGRRYPIQDTVHARNALARVAQHGTPEEQATVKAKVEKKYPGIEQGEEKMASKYVCAECGSHKIRMAGEKRASIESRKASILAKLAGDATGAQDLPTQYITVGAPSPGAAVRSALYDRGMGGRPLARDTPGLKQVNPQEYAKQLQTHMAGKAAPAVVRPAAPAAARPPMVPAAPGRK